MVTSEMGSERQFRVTSIPGKGRGLVADTVIEAGSAIVAEEPYIACLEDDTIKKRSSHSFQASDSLSWCGGCNLVGYTCKMEQQVDWRAGHKYECKSLRRCKPACPDIMIRLAARLLWMRSGSSAKGKNQARPLAGMQQKSNAFKPEDLVSHWSTMHTARKARYYSKAAKVRAYMDEWIPAETAEDAIAELLALLDFNTFQIGDLEQPHGTALYLMAALVNHDCRPNSAMTYHGTMLTIRAVRDIAVGEEITINYSPVVASKLESRLLLLNIYHFDTLTPEEMRVMTSWDRFTEKRLIGCNGIKVLCLFWSRPPCKFDALDSQLVQVVAGDKARSGSGFIAQDLQSFPFNLLRGGADCTKDRFGMYSTAMTSSASMIVHAWGPAFKKGNDTSADTDDWQEIFDLASFSAACLHLLRAKQNCPADTDAQAEVWKLCEAVDRADSRGEISVKLGPRHSLRQQVTEAKAFTLLHMGKLKQSLPLMEEAHKFAEFMKPMDVRSCLLLEISLARQAMMLSEYRVGAKYARLALKKLRLLFPLDRTIVELELLLRMCKLEAH